MGMKTNTRSLDGVFYCDVLLSTHWSAQRILLAKKQEFGPTINVYVHTVSGNPLTRLVVHHVFLLMPEKSNSEK